MDRTKLLCFTKVRRAGLMLALALNLSGHVAGAHELSVQECREGADYIRNAALSRDNGMSESSFMDIFDNDMALISRVPPSLRWFVQDKEDEHFLRSALNEVFRRPQPPQQHAESFAEACLLRAGEWNVNGKMRI